MLPPIKKHRVADQLEPRSELERRVCKLRLELLGRDVRSCLHLVGVDVKVNLALDEEDVVN